MAFGNPYNDVYDAAQLTGYVQKLSDIGIKIISLADTIGSATPGTISKVFEPLIKMFPDVEFGAHLHSTPNTALEKIEAAYTAGCRRFDGAIKGFGGCPMAKEDLTGNIATELMIEYFNQKGEETGIDGAKFAIAMNAAVEIFSIE